MVTDVLNELREKIVNLTANIIAIFDVSRYFFVLPIKKY